MAAQKEEGKTRFVVLKDEPESSKYQVEPRHSRPEAAKTNDNICTPIRTSLVPISPDKKKVAERIQTPYYTNNSKKDDYCKGGGADVRRTGSVRFGSSSSEILDNEAEEDKFNAPERSQQRLTRISNRQKTGPPSSLSSDQLATLQKQMPPDISGKKEDEGFDSRTTSFVEGRSCDAAPVGGGLSPRRSSSSVRFSESIAANPEQAEEQGYWSPTRREERHQRVTNRRKTGKLNEADLSEVRRRFSDISGKEDEGGFDSHTTSFVEARSCDDAPVGGGLSPSRSSSTVRFSEPIAANPEQEEQGYWSPTRREERHQRVTNRRKTGKLNEADLSELRLRFSEDETRCTGNGSLAAGDGGETVMRCFKGVVGTDNNMGISNGNVADSSSGEVEGGGADGRMGENGRSVRFGFSSFELSDNEDVEDETFNDPDRSKVRVTRIASRRKTGPPSRLTEEQLADLQGLMASSGSSVEQCRRQGDSESAMYEVDLSAVEKEDEQTGGVSNAEKEDVFAANPCGGRHQRLTESRPTEDEKQLRKRAPCDGEMESGGREEMSTLISGTIERTVRFGSSSFDLSEGDDGHKFNDPARTEQRFVRIAGRRKTGPKNLTTEQLRILGRMCPAEEEDDDEDLHTVAAASSSSTSSSAATARSPKKAGAVGFAETANVEKNDEECEQRDQGVSERRKAVNESSVDEITARRNGEDGIVEEGNGTLPFERQGRHHLSDGSTAPLHGAATTGTVGTEEEHTVEETEINKLRSVRFGSSSCVSDEEADGGQTFDDPTRRQLRFSRISTRRKTGALIATAEPITALRRIAASETAEVAAGQPVDMLPSKKAGSVRFAATSGSTGADREEECFSIGRSIAGGGPGGKGDRPKIKDEERRLSSITNVSTDTGGSSMNCPGGDYDALCDVFCVFWFDCGNTLPAGDFEGRKGASTMSMLT
eukprot:GHVS01057860.1.p1 GENE.GHVS01057860.1~~GHVS01057860.1.p1  ORF type:complete len:939 (+),score=162.30 GHVS01057860.1:355-3171(+)